MKGISKIKKIQMSNSLKKFCVINTQKDKNPLYPLKKIKISLLESDEKDLFKTEKAKIKSSKYILVKT